METMLTQAREDYETGKFERAAKGFRAVVAAEPGNALGHQGLGQCLNRLGEYQEAAEECKTALGLDQGLAIPHAVLGGIYYRQCRLEESEVALRKAIELDSMLVEPRICLGATLTKMGRSEEAVRVLRTALELRPRSSIARYNLAITYTEQGRHADAIGEAFRAFRLGASVKTARLLMVSALAGLAGQRTLLWVLMVALLVVPFLIRSLVTLPLFALGMGAYLILGVRLLTRSGHRTRGMVLLVLVLTLTGLYMCGVLQVGQSE